LGSLYINVKTFAIEKNAYKAIVICIDPGHQSRGDSETEPIAPGSKIKKAKVSSGTTGVFTKVPEYKLNLKIALKLEKLLKNEGFQIIMTRSVNEVNVSNVERANIANDGNADISIRIHADGSTDRNMKGISVLYPGKTSVKQEVYEKSKTAAQMILTSVLKETGANAKGTVPRNDLTGFNWSKVPSILIETGFMTNISEDKKLENSNYQDNIARGIVLGIESYFKESIKTK
jgi:N-acetylmuramoyl-L-alanine amidase